MSRAAVAPFSAIVLIACTGEPAPPAAPAQTTAPVQTAVPAQTATPAPPAASAAPGELQQKVAACPDGQNECLEVVLPAEGYLSFVGSSPHLLGCGDRHGGTIVASIEQRMVRLEMKYPLPGGHGLCRAMATMFGEGKAGPLAAGTWLLVPDHESQSGARPNSPLRLGTVTFSLKP